MTIEQRVFVWFRDSGPARLKHAVAAFPELTSRSVAKAIERLRAHGYLGLDENVYSVAPGTQEPYDKRGKRAA